MDLRVSSEVDLEALKKQLEYLDRVGSFLDTWKEDEATRFPWSTLNYQNGSNQDQKMENFEEQLKETDAWKNCEQFWGDLAKAPTEVPSFENRWADAKLWHIRENANAWWVNRLGKSRNLLRK